MTGDDRLKITRRNLPHWQLAGSTYFITFRTISGILAEVERSIVLNHLRAGDGRFYELFAAVIMPDHVHALLKPADTVDLTRILKGIKGVSARLINQHRQASGNIWLDESFDRIMRNASEFDEKLTYMINNPAKADLVTDGWEYPWLFVTKSTAG